ncbi:phytoene desaturase family protein [Pelagibacteraceae bacterium]|nr:phytoene desaturase family protein [Candidatus Pelagibacter bacterium]MDC0409525.1 phytoene desaturase family protein [Pelagibacteraceae bacterium]MDC0447484.1 phytoene desaturase family protein [Pelagibacteraceae bacterium]
MAKKIIVIGSGFGGLAASLRLKAKGYKVTLVEKHPDLGGRARVFKKDQFIYDGGPTVITAPYLFEELFTLFNKNISDYVKIVPLDLWYRFVFNDGESFDYNGDSISMEEQVKKFNPDDYKGYKKLVNFTEKIFDKGFTDLSDKPFNNLVFMIKQIPSLLKLKSYKSVYSLVSSFISNEKLRRVFSMHPLLVGGNPFSTTSIYTLILFLEKKWGIHYSMGGTGSVVQALEKLMLEENIKIIKGAEVTEILTENKKVKGIKINNSKIINSDYIICNSDPPNVYNNLIKSKEDYNFLFKQKMKRMDYSMGLFVYYFGSKKKYDHVAHHTIYFGETYEKHLDKIFEKKILSQDISYYLHRPSATDPNMAPNGQDAFYVLVPVPNNLSKINWIKQGDKFKELVLDKMDKTVLPGIKENVVSDFYLTPDYFEIDLATLYGSGFSIQPKFSQSAYFRFHNQSEIYKNLYFVGAGTHPGAGMPGVLSSAKVLDKLFNE